MIKHVVESTSIEGYSVTVHPGQCFVSRGFRFAGLADLRRSGTIGGRYAEPEAVPAAVIEQITAWAKARGWTKERKRVD